MRLARETIVVAARAAGIDALDTVFSNLNDMETFRREVEYIKTLGFDGKSIINPRQIEVVNEGVHSYGERYREGQGHRRRHKGSGEERFGSDSAQWKMIDRPVVIRAERTITLAKAAGLLTEEDI